MRRQIENVLVAARIRSCGSLRQRKKRVLRLWKDRRLDWLGGNRKLHISSSFYRGGDADWLASAGLLLFTRAIEEPKLAPFGADFGVPVARVMPS